MGLGWEEPGLWTRSKMRGKEKGWPINQGKGKVRANQKRPNARCDIPFAIGSHRSCSFTSNSPGCPCTSWWSLSMCSCSSPDCASGSSSASFEGEFDMIISGLDCGSSAWASMCVSRALLSDHVRSQCRAIASVSDSAESAPKSRQGCIGWVQTILQ